MTHCNFFISFRQLEFIFVPCECSVTGRIWQPLLSTAQIGTRMLYMCWGIHSATIRATCNLSSLIALSFYLFRIQTYGWKTNVILLHRLVNYDAGESNGTGILLPKCTNITINLLKTKRNLLYIRNQSVPRCKHFLLWL
jgi:hypothetical protein